MTKLTARINRRRALVAGGSLVGALAGVSALAGQAQAQGPALAQAASIDWKAVEKSLGQSGQMMEGGVYSFTPGRTDLKPTVEGVRIQPDFALSLEANFMAVSSMGTGGMAMVMGEIPLRDTEISPTISRLMAGGIMVSAVHNHRMMMAPQVWWIHFSGQGQATKLATALRQALPMGASFSSGSQGNSPLDAKGLATILGGTSTTSGGVVEVGVERGDKITMNGMVVPPAMGVESDVYFQPLGGGRAAVEAELALHAAEVDPVMRALRGRNFQIQALHNHMLNEVPRLFFLHAWATGDAMTLARDVRAALDLSNSKKA